VGGLKFTAARISGEIRVPRSTTFVFAGVAILAIASVAALSSFSLMVPTSPIDNLDKTVSLNLLAALLLFVYGIIVVLTHRHLFKLALGLLIMTAGAHLTLIQMAPKFFTMVEIEVLTKVMGTVFAMLYAARLLSERFQSADASELLSSQE
jgi:hydrogenase-4 membrane subunit HyfE